MSTPREFGFIEGVPVMILKAQPLKLTSRKLFVQCLRTGRTAIVPKEWVDNITTQYPYNAPKSVTQ